MTQDGELASMARKPPVFAGAGRRWVFLNLAISVALGFTAAELYWRLYALPRREKRDKYYRDRGVDWVRLVD